MHKISRDSILATIPSVQSSGERQQKLRITKEGDVYLRKLLVQGAHCLMTAKTPDTDLKRWGTNIASRGGKNARSERSRSRAAPLISLIANLVPRHRPNQPLTPERAALKPKQRPNRRFRDHFPQAVFALTHGIENRRTKRISAFDANTENRVTQVNPTGAAARRLQFGDRILAVNGCSGFVLRQTALRFFGRLLPGDTVYLLVERDGKTLRVSFPRPLGPGPWLCSTGRSQRHAS